MPIPSSSAVTARPRFRAKPRAAEEGKTLYLSVPDSEGADKNLLLLGSSGVSGLYAEDKRKYEEAITGFFNNYLRAHQEKPAEAIRVKEK